MHEARKLRQRARPERRLVAHLLREAAHARPARSSQRSRIGCARAPQVEVGIELAAEALDLQQRLLQQHELRLDLHAEAPRDLEEAHQQLAEVDLLQRPVEDRLAHRADRALELVHARVARHPARLDVRDRDAVVVAVEERA